MNIYPPVGDAFSALERSEQSLSPFYPNSAEAPSMPLYSLAEIAPALDDLAFKANRVPHPFSNDVCTAPYFEQLQARTLTPEYMEAPNRVALVVGESALAANLRFIPEDTIVIADISPDMCTYMQNYIEGLRTLDDPEQWLRFMKATSSKEALEHLEYQLQVWQDAGYAHPFDDRNAFLEAQKLAQQKVIIPWNLDLTNPVNVNELGMALEEHGATVTAMNLTNLLYCLHPNEARDVFTYLHMLPVTSQAPILTSSLMKIRPVSELEQEAQFFYGRQNHVTGPFFGLGNLYAAYCQPTNSELGAIDTRDYIERGAQSFFDSPHPLAQIALALMSGGDDVRELIIDRLISLEDL